MTEDRRTHGDEPDVEPPESPHVHYIPCKERRRLRAEAALQRRIERTFQESDLRRQIDEDTAED